MLCMSWLVCYVCHGMYVMLCYLFHPRFVVPIPSALYHLARIRVDISLISPLFPTRVISLEIRLISLETRVISWKPW